jgi:hypothetical protein
LILESRIGFVPSSAKGIDATVVVGRSLQSATIVRTSTRSDVLLGCLSLRLVFVSSSCLNRSEGETLQSEASSGSIDPLQPPFRRRVDERVCSAQIGRRDC